MTGGDDAAVATIDRTGAILEAALTLFGERGYHRVGMDDIGAVVGVSGPAIYRHFPNKAALLAAVIEHEGAQLLADAQDVIARAASPRDALEALIWNLTLKVVQDDSRLGVTYLQQERGVPKDARARVVEYHRRYVEQLAGVLSAIRSELTDEERQLRTEAIIGLINASVFFVTPIDRKLVGEQLVAMALKVLADE